jgi:hypothetical protein
MKCPKCDRSNWSVIETRTAAKHIRRRRECECGHRVTTLESIVEADGNRLGQDLMSRSVNNALVRRFEFVQDRLDLLLELAGDIRAAVPQSPRRIAQQDAEDEATKRQISLFPENFPSNDGLE